MLSKNGVVARTPDQFLEKTSRVAWTPDQFLKKTSRVARTPDQFLKGSYCGVLKAQLQKMYFGRCDVFGQREVIFDNHVSGFEEVLIYSDVPCKLSFGTSNASKTNFLKANDVNSRISQNVVLFIDNEVDVLAGSKIVVRQDGVSNTYRFSGKPSVFWGHQEIGVVLVGEA